MKSNSKVISQREAHRLRQQVKAQADRIQQLEWVVRRWRVSRIAEGTEIFEVNESGASLNWALRTASLLGHVVVCRQRGNSVSYLALPLPEEKMTD